MKTITLHTEIGADGHLTIDVPSGLPAGPVEVVIELVQVVAGNDLETKRPRRPLRGILKGVEPIPSFEEIKELRREMWRNFPREDI